MDWMAQLMDDYRATQRLRWTGTLAEYVALVKEQPTITRLAHQRLNDAIRAAGVETTPEGPRYRFFDPVLVGDDAPLRLVMEYLGGAAQGLDVRRRILLLIGPPGSGKSTLVAALKRLVGDYSRTEAGALYGIVDCPIHEEPLHLIPPHLRDAVATDLGVTIEGSLCPRCQQRYDAEGPEAFRVERLVLSEEQRLGVGTFVPGNEKDLSLDHLVGSLDFSKIAEYGSESDPRAFRFDGELEVANRGIMEQAEWLKLPQTYQYELLSLAMERQIKLPRYAMLYLDEVVLAHSNNHEYAKFVADKSNEAMANRVFVVHMPYVVNTVEEQTIYTRMLAQGAVGQTHVAPHTLALAARFAVLTRLEPAADASIDLRLKSRLYDGERIGDVTDASVRALREEHPHEGMTGLSPRDTMNVLTHALGETGVPCVNAIDYLRALKDWIQHERFVGTVGKARDDLEQFRTWIREEWDERVRTDVQKAFIHAFETSAQTLLDAYLTHAEAWGLKEQVPDPVTGDLRDPDTAFLRQIEERIGVSEIAASAFREEILKKAGALARRGGRFEWDTHPRLKEALSDKLFADAKQLMVGALTTKTPDPEQQEKLADVQARLKDAGYCDHCAQAALQYVGWLIQRPAPEKGAQ
ncbi:PrkA family serine protein kinase [Sulfobacillus harzensis]|uniref:Protein prkA n=1 Tax=Sulfobacillus harzensis TaxID=2729629 RepID=A0A7Y0Q3R6_9FIRM|nr:protein prkA [Sulfobacillus harzensis]NMP23822.1 protein prkA [Sulfobacillus harzensis]